MLHFYKLSLYKNKHFLFSCLFFFNAWGKVIRHQGPDGQQETWQRPDPLRSILKSLRRPYFSSFSEGQAIHRTRSTSTVRWRLNSNLTWFDFTDCRDWPSDLVLGSQATSSIFFWPDPSWSMLRPGEEITGAVGDLAWLSHWSVIQSQSHPTDKPKFIQLTQTLAFCLLNENDATGY